MRAAMATATIVMTIAMVSPVAAAGATDDFGPASGAAYCTGDLVIDLAARGPRLLNTDGFRTHGPVPVELAAGTYTVTAASWDRHGPDQTTQPEEQWRVVADSGWQSPLTADIPDTVDVSASTWTDQRLDAAVASITLVHKSAGIINSVTPLCVGFTRTTAPVAPETDPGTTPGDGQPAPGPDDPVADGSATSIVRPPEDVATSTTAPEATQTTTPSADGTSDRIEPEVKGQVELPPVLPRTGRSPLTRAITIAAVALLGLGGYAVGWSKRLRLGDAEQR